MEKCNPTDPNRCQGVTPHGQCEYPAFEGERFCKFHAHIQESKIKRAKQERYILDSRELRAAYERQLGDVDYLSLKEEILLTQAILERRLNAIKTDADIMMAIGPLTQLIQRLESMKISLLKIQQALGMVLSKDHLRVLAREISQTLDEELEGIEDKEERIEKIAKRILAAIESAGQKEQE